MRGNRKGRKGLRGGRRGNITQIPNARELFLRPRMLGGKGGIAKEVPKGTFIPGSLTLLYDSTKF